MLPVNTMPFAKRSTHFMPVANVTTTVLLTRSLFVLPIRPLSKTSASFTWTLANVEVTTPYIIQEVVQVRKCILLASILAVALTVVQTNNDSDNDINKDNDKSKKYISFTGCEVSVGKNCARGRE